MASHKMTFSLPGDLAEQFVRRVPSRARSAYVSEAIASRLRQQEDRLIRACEAANRDLDAAAIEREWDALETPVEERWTGAEAR